MGLSHKNTNTVCFRSCCDVTSKDGSTFRTGHLAFPAASVGREDAGGSRGSMDKNCLGSVQADVQSSSALHSESCPCPPVSVSPLSMSSCLSESCPCPPVSVSPVHVLLSQ
uniref:Uncharacterized protein n=1 Tax=Knipowitschia caucasica TaxID=637954 RepID=A0AAV2IW20_KNICA